MTIPPAPQAQEKPSFSLAEPGEPLAHIMQTLTAMLPELRDRYGVITLGVFGSYGRGEQTPDSDLDLLVEFDPAVRFGLLTYCELENLLRIDLPSKSISS
jgi:predicted nucleotidyltransferase